MHTHAVYTHTHHRKTPDDINADTATFDADARLHERGRDGFGICTSGCPGATRDVMHPNTDGKRAPMMRATGRELQWHRIRRDTTAEAKPAEKKALLSLWRPVAVPVESAI